MKTLSRILTVILCCTPAFSAVAAGTVATTAGSNLTAYNPSDAYNNQWASLTNGRYDDAGAAKVDFGNCNALVLRCAQPKCGAGGCTDYSVAGGIVAGCVQSNDKCKKYGDDLVNYMTAQLVASSQTKLNQQQMAMEQARIQAEAEAQAAAAAAANAQSQEQIAQMQSQMQQMQAQMAQQQAESAAQLQAALDAQAAQSAAALNDMKEVATAAAKQTEAGITAYQQEAIDRDVSKDTLLRQTMTGQIQTSIEDMKKSLEDVRQDMLLSFDYAGCTTRGDNCTGPKRIKKWRELASAVIDPYDNAVEKLEDALEDARMAGVDLSQIYAMLDNACSSWSQYLCPSIPGGGNIVYGVDDSGGQRGEPWVCPSDNKDNEKRIDYCAGLCVETDENGRESCNTSKYHECMANNTIGCKRCTWLKSLTSEEDIYEGWVNAETTVQNGNTTVVACGSSALVKNRIIGGRSRRKNGAGVVSMDQMETWLGQREPDTYIQDENVGDYCTVANLNDLQKVTQSRSINANEICTENKGKVDKNNLQSLDSDECSYIVPTYGICDTHAYNYGTSTKDPMCKPANHQDKACELDSDQMAKIKEVVALKTTVVSQQMYKQYEYLKATLRRFEILLKKALLTATLEAAGAKDEDGSSSRVGGLAGGGIDKDKEIVLPGAENCWNSNSRDDKYKCLQNNLNLIKSNVSTNKQKSKQQLDKAVAVAESLDIKKVKCSVYKTDNNGKEVCQTPSPCNTYSSKDEVLKCANHLSMLIADAQDEREDRKNRNRGWGYQP